MGLSVKKDVYLMLARLKKKTIAINKFTLNRATLNNHIDVSPSPIGCLPINNWKRMSAYSAL